MQKTRSYTYWKKPWAKWCVLAAGLLKLLALWINLNDYRQVSSVWDQIMSEDAWKSYASNMLFNCSLNGFMVLMFFACLLNGSLARSERTARRNDGITLLLWAVLWGAARLCFPQLWYSGQKRFWWLLLLLMALGGWVFSLCKSRKL